MTDSLALLSKWFFERPQWTQIAASRLLEMTELTDKDISELARLYQHEAEVLFSGRSLA